jgi:3-hydroxyacyl-[acyl-carrier-protein] dehydratase
VEITAIKNVAMSEEYLGDHFPEFPVLPGVFMLEAATQAGAWLLRLSENFAHSIISLKEARNVKYADFVQPGQTLEVTMSMVKKDDRLATFKMEGQQAGRQTLSGRLVLERYNLADRDPEKRPIDELLIRHFRRLETIIRPTRQPA